MTFKQQRWIPYGKKARYINIGVKDNFKQTIESFELEKGKDIDNLRKLKKIREKYDFDLSPEEDIKKIKENENRWLDKDMELW